jgi:phosphoglycolate phosphatase-like HAD superfamily hydrolase
MEQWDAIRPRKFKHLFLDAEGTLYVPKGGRSRWVFWADPTPEAALEFFELDTGVYEALHQLRGQVDTLCLVSRNTEDILGALLEKFGIRGFFDEIMLNGDKGRQIERYLCRNGFKKEESLMVGDMPGLDLFPVKRAGIEAVLVDRVYNSWAKAERIKGLSDLPSWLKIADLVDDMERNRSRNATLDEFAIPVASTGTICSNRSATKRLIAVPGA